MRLMGGLESWKLSRDSNPQPAATTYGQKQSKAKSPHPIQLGGPRSVPGQGEPRPAVSGVPGLGER